MEESILASTREFKVFRVHTGAPLFTTVTRVVLSIERVLSRIGGIANSPLTAGFANGVGKVLFDVPLGACTASSAEEH